MRRNRGTPALAGLAALTVVGLGAAHAAEVEKSFQVYGFAMLDYIQDFGRVHPDWEDTLRPSRIGIDEEQYGDDGQASFSVKQSRLGVKGTVPTARGPINTRFEFDMFGVGDDAGQTTIRLRHAYGEFGQFLAGQTHSLFMDIDVFPNVIDYWGPTGMVFLRNPQIRWTPVTGENFFAVAIENPSNDIDSGQFREVADFPGAQGDQEWPDLTAQYRMTGDWGHVQLAGIVRWVGTEVVGDTNADPGIVDQGVIFDDDDTGWGLNLTTVIKVFERDAIRAGYVIGEGIASYMNDGGMDAGPNQGLLPDGSLPGDTKLEAVELSGLTLYYDRWWSDQWSSSAGYSFTDVDNTVGQLDDTYEKGQYASANLLYYPVKNVMVGAEILWGELAVKDGRDNDNTRVQISFKYDFAANL
ncbi:MAG: DcaP family trimeric outer membrane transporter [Gammaproteobacteria bacterium]|nr:MAG: DcaP family trimeric outer membrane transporter [Gammaproteobacteria bacterium]